MYRPEISSSRAVQLGHFGQKCSRWRFFIPSRYILASLGKHGLPGVFALLISTFWPFWGKYVLASGFHYKPVQFGHFSGKCTGWEFFILNWYIMATLAENVPAEGFLFSAGRFWPFRGNMYRQRIFYSWPVGFGHFGKNVPAGIFVFLAGTSMYRPARKWPKLAEIIIMQAPKNGQSCQ